VSDNPQSAFIMTVSGVNFDLTNPSGSDFRFIDGVAGITRACRFGGQISEEFADHIYSVAQHSCYVHDLLLMFGHDRAALWGLMHDFLEGYFSDTITPIKRLLPLLTEMEDRAANLLCSQWGIPRSMTIDERVHWADQVMGCVEAFRLKERHQAQEMYDCENPPITMSQIDPDFHCWSPLTARKQFTARYQRAKKTAMEQ